MKIIENDNTTDSISSISSIYGIGRNPRKTDGIKEVRLYPYMHINFECEISDPPAFMRKERTIGSPNPIEYI